MKKNENKKKTISWLSGQPVEVKAAVMNHHMELTRMLINEILADEVEVKAGRRYRHEPQEQCPCYRWGSNPGSVKVGSERIPVDVPRVVDKRTKRGVTLENYATLRELSPPDERLINAVLLGLSTGDYARVAKELSDSFGLSSSSVSRQFIEHSSEKLREFESRDLSPYHLVGLHIDGKYLAKEQIIIAMGVTGQGEKIPLGFTQAATENSRAVKQLLAGLIERGMGYRHGLLVVIDGSKGIAKAVKDAFGQHAIIQRCRWHKTGNVTSYLKEKDQVYYRRKLQAAYRHDDYHQARHALRLIEAELKQLNVTAARSLAEGMEETLTLQKLGVNKWFSRSFGTTNCIENLNSQLVKYIRKVKYWKNSSQRYRWVAASLLEIERKMRRVNNYQKLYWLENVISDTVSQRLNNTQQAA